jgi:hypothetical protein
LKFHKCVLHHIPCPFSIASNARGELQKRTLETAQERPRAIRIRVRASVRHIVKEVNARTAENLADFFAHVALPKRFKVSRKIMRPA